MPDQQPDLDTIQTLDLLALMDDRAAATVSGHLAAHVASAATGIPMPTSAADPIAA